MLVVTVLVAHFHSQLVVQVQVQVQGSPYHQAQPQSLQQRSPS
jgi:hypothetical protein